MKKNLLITLLFYSTFINAQITLTLKNVIDSTLKNNFDIKIAENNLEIAKISNNYGNAGGFPSLNVSVSDNISQNNSKQEYNDGSSDEIADNSENSFNIQANSSITLFNGFKIYATKKRLEYLENISEIEFNSQIQNSIADVMICYYDIIRQQIYLNIMQSLLDISQQKLDIINNKSNIGLASSVDILQAQSDVNTASQNCILQQMLINQAKQNLLHLMSINCNYEINIFDTITVDTTLQINDILFKIGQNPDLQTSNLYIKIFRQIETETTAMRYPSLKFNASYNFAKTDYSKGYTLLNQNFGPNAGFSLQIPIYNGNMYYTQQKVASLNLQNSMIEREKKYNTIHYSAAKAFLSYSTALQQIIKQKANYQLSKKLVDLVIQNFQNGQATILEVKAAQSSFESAAYQLVNFQYVAKISEIELKLLIFQLTY